MLMGLWFIFSTIMIMGSMICGTLLMVKMIVDACECILGRWGL